MSLNDLLIDTTSQGARTQSSIGKAEALAHRLTMVAIRMMDGKYESQITTTPKQHLLMLTGDIYIFVEQSKKTGSQWAKRALEGQSVVQVFRKTDKKLIGVACDNVFTFYDTQAEYVLDFGGKFKPVQKVDLTPYLPFDKDPIFTPEMSGSDCLKCASGACNEDHSNAPAPISVRHLSKPRRCAKCNKRRLLYNYNMCNPCLSHA